ncbi:MAG TPA: phosphatidylserine decarboxylase family protein [Bacteroidales bacterium]|jgi:phosphatidylserine decarboxylase|nr:phosphatidylserine decarboxylase family protein [Bacteroidales bacterium]HPS70887.1 phosphatidylserine decarboxylase family protein [Bacteroidales bacterium]
MRIHKEGINTILISTLFVALVLFGYEKINKHTPTFLDIIIYLGFVLFLFLIIRFFRVPGRIVNRVPNGVVSPADGTIVQILESIEDEYFQDSRLQISIFMSPLNVHVNTYPIDGKVSYVAYHPGKHLVASLPKASKDNEHNTVVVKSKNGDEVLFRQIAGFVARRIVSYVKKDADAAQGGEMGIIKFGSRVDMFLPLNYRLNVKVGDKVTSKKTVIAYID